MYKARLMLVSTLLVFFIIPTAVPADAEDLTRWSLLNSQLRAATEGGGVFVAVGKNGFILRSTNGSQWDRVTSGVDKDLSDVAYGNGIFVAVGSGIALVSTNGLSWQAYSPSSFYPNSIAFGNSFFVTLSWNAVHTSNDGINWNTVDISSVTSNYMTHILYGDGVFVAVGYGGTIITSDVSPYATWIPQASHTARALWQVTHGNGTYVVVGESGTVITSSNAQDWTVETTGITQTLMAVGFGNGVFVLSGGNSSSDAGHIWTSPTALGATWAPQTSGAFEWFFDVLYGGGKYLAVGGKILSSTDAITWNIAHGATGWDIWEIAYGNGVYVATTLHTANIIISPNGVRWKQPNYPVGLGSITGMAYGPKNRRFVGTLSDGRLIYSDDAGASWNVHAFTASGGLSGIEYLHDRFIGFGYGGRIIVSVDGESWSEVSTGSSNSLQAAAYGNNTYVVVGSGADVYTSSDGALWTPHSTPATSELYGVAYGNGKFLAVDFYGDVMTSLDGIDWTPGTNIGSGYFYTVRFYNGLFLAMGQTYGYIYTSVEGTSWNSIKTPSNTSLFTACIRGPSVIVAGYEGTIVGHLKPHPIPWILLLDD